MSEGFETRIVSGEPKKIEVDGKHISAKCDGPHPWDVKVLIDGEVPSMPIERMAITLSSDKPPMAVITYVVS